MYPNFVAFVDISCELVMIRLMLLIRLWVLRYRYVSSQTVVCHHLFCCSKMNKERKTNENRTTLNCFKLLSGPVYWLFGGFITYHYRFTNFSLFYYTIYTDLGQLNPLPAVFRQKFTALLEFISCAERFLVGQFIAAVGLPSKTSQHIL